MASNVNATGRDFVLVDMRDFNCIMDQYHFEKIFTQGKEYITVAWFAPRASLIPHHHQKNNTSKSNYHQHQFT